MSMLILKVVQYLMYLYIFIGEVILWHPKSRKIIKEILVDMSKQTMSNMIPRVIENF